MAAASSILSLFNPPADIKPIIKPELTEDQTTKIQSLIDHFGAPDYALPVKEHAEDKVSLSNREMMFLSKETLVRFLVGTKDDLPATITRLENCLIWRRTEDVENVERMADACAPESKTGKNIALGFSTKGQPILYFFPNRSYLAYDSQEVLDGFSGRSHPLVYMLERAKDLMCAGVTNTFVVFNWHGKKQGPSTPLSVVKSTNHILSNFYPETLGLSSFQDIPWVFKTLINLVWPFVDPATKKKVKFGSGKGREIVKEGDVAASQLLQEAGGDLDIPYDHDSYWPALLNVCLQLRKDEEERWIALGDRQVGREEKQFKRHAGGTASEVSH
ncbi:uncharacterized protein I303_101029 [Kwoniella dejecticola CBS 10117]|uniref:CRAL-TRIO domain-containing protein n=1 Tax=Kwoniella dejecticola CBS 10117 TaxID=1296121 RepID=A0A1A6AGL9_9TREE|nr:uncharacterized protein I303_01032 [Kwoniella dejecticola CBS 10117]OBR89207.1 hypothetical protein I303_01032 [Kwoniella dejecticola CBS 10117]